MKLCCLQSWRPFLKVSVFAVLIALMVIIGYRPDDWAAFDHRMFKANKAVAGDSIQINSANGKTETVKLLGIDAIPSAQSWLNTQVVGQEVTLLLESPQTRDALGRLQAFVFLMNENLGVELVRIGLARADRREKTEMDGLIGPAQAEARKKKQGIWRVS